MLPTVQTKEVVLGFPAGFTLVAGGGRKHAHPENTLASRHRLLAQSLSPGVLAAGIGHVLVERQVLSSVGCLGALVSGEYGGGLGTSLSGAYRPSATLGLETSLESARVLVRELACRQSAREGVVSHVHGPQRKKHIPRAFPPKWWRWRTIISTRWSHLGEHINLLECRAFCLALRWRARRVRQHH